ncbi:hypothetical protein ACFLZZ_03570 [Nanoarchaeota archaeon]
MNNKKEVLLILLVIFTFLLSSTVVYAASRSANIDTSARQAAPEIEKEAEFVKDAVLTVGDDEEYRKLFEKGEWKESRAKIECKKEFCEEQITWNIGTDSIEYNIRAKIRVPYTKEANFLLDKAIIVKDSCNMAERKPDEIKLEFDDCYLIGGAFIDPTKVTVPLLGTGAPDPFLEGGTKQTTEAGEVSYDEILQSREILKVVLNPSINMGDFDNFVQQQTEIFRGKDEGEEAAKKIIEEQAPEKTILEKIAEDAQKAAATAEEEKAEQEKTKQTQSVEIGFSELDNKVNALISLGIEKSHCLALKMLTPEEQKKSASINEICKKGEFRISEVDTKEFERNLRSSPDSLKFLSKVDLPHVSADIPIGNFYLVFGKGDNVEKVAASWRLENYEKQGPLKKFGQNVVRVARDAGEDMRKAINNIREKLGGREAADGDKKIDSDNKGATQGESGSGGSTGGAGGTGTTPTTEPKKTEPGKTEGLTPGGETEAFKKDRPALKAITKGAGGSLFQKLLGKTSSTYGSGEGSEDRTEGTPGAITGEEATGTTEGDITTETDDTTGEEKKDSETSGSSGLTDIGGGGGSGTGETPTVECGNNKCEEGETTETCEDDCPSKIVCGDGTCSGDETTSSCAGDCPLTDAGDPCGDGVCSSNENNAICAVDCPIEQPGPQPDEDFDDFFTDDFNFDDEDFFTSMPEPIDQGVNPGAAAGGIGGTLAFLGAEEFLRRTGRLARLFKRKKKLNPIQKAAAAATA